MGGREAERKAGREGREGAVKPMTTMIFTFKAFSSFFFSRGGKGMPGKEG